MIEEMKRYGYTEENIYTKQNRKKKKIKRYFFQTMIEENVWEEVEETVFVYITKEIAEKIPEELYLASTFDDHRIIFGSEKDLLENKNAIFGAVNPGTVEPKVPHLLFERELEND